MPNPIDRARDRGARAALWSHRLAWLTAAATFPLLFIGGLVTSKGAGLAVPDWPTTFGYNMFLYPWSQMVGGIFYEHSHRLVASGVGFLTLVLALFLWLNEDRPWLRWLGMAALLLVITQGVLGGLRVVLLQQTLAIVHACFAQAFFALAVSLAFFTSAEWKSAPGNVELLGADALRRLSILTTVLIYVQGIFGAVLRFTGARLEFHLLFAGLVTLHVVFLVIRVVRFHAHEGRLLRPALFLGALLVIQLLLGLGSYFAKFTPWLGLSSGAIVTLTTTHVVTGALMLVTSLNVALKSYWFYTSREPVESQSVLSEQVST